MAIDGFPAAISGVIEQPGYLERKFREGAQANYGYRPAATVEPIEVGTGESVTKTRPQMLTPKTSPINPANNTGLDNGLTVSNRGFEQYILTLSTYADTLNLSLEQAETLIASLFIDNAEKLGEGAAQTLDSLCAQVLHTAYDSGDTYALGTAAAGATATVHVDNRIGFDTNFNAALAPSLGLPQPVSNSNSVPVMILDGTLNTWKGSASAVGYTDDVPNVSSSFYGNIAYGISSVINLTNLTVAIAAGDRIVAMDRNSPLTSYSPIFKDGGHVIRPNNKGTRAALASTDTLTLPIIATAKAKLRMRGTKPFRNGMYVAVVDDVLMAQLASDTAFQRATATNFERSPIFKNGIIHAQYGIEFVSSTSVPVYNAGAAGSGLLARHALIMGEGALVEGPFVGTERAARQSAQMGISDFKLVDRILMITRPGIDRFGDIIAQTYKYTGAFAAPTDKGSTPFVLPTTDWTRYKRAVTIECGSVV